MRTSILKLSGKKPYSIRYVGKNSTPEELKELLKLYQALEKSQADISKHSKVDPIKFTKPQFVTEEDCLNNGRMLGAFVEGKLVGFIAFERRETKAEGTIGAIEFLYVDPAHRRKGIAEALFAQAKDTMTKDGKVDYLSLGLLYDNKAAIGFYTSLGMHPYGMTMIMGA